MSTGISIAGRAHRALRGMSRYSSIKNDVPHRCDERLLALVREGESLIGYYDNSNSRSGQILVTDQGLLVLEEDAADRLDYSEITGILTPETKNVRHLDIHLSGGRTVALPIRGGDGQIRDAFSFLTFLRHAVAVGG